MVLVVVGGITCFRSTSQVHTVYQLCAWLEARSALDDRHETNLICLRDEEERDDIICLADWRYMVNGLDLPARIMERELDDGYTYALVNDDPAE